MTTDKTKNLTQTREREDEKTTKRHQHSTQVNKRIHLQVLPLSLTDHTINWFGS